jgi:hypothetical protein
MYEIEMHEITEVFFPCRKAACIQLSKQADGGIQSWLRGEVYPRFLSAIRQHCKCDRFRVSSVDSYTKIFECNCLGASFVS